ncbi:uncharacterized protein Nmag_2269 [Natrialba magadii ATCC 43099]|uniref:Uncharacterized protein n=1 Tax=Natrialba magadii (strain ATCC 43099 / DSM 3394 / CCM 3739 / CIP 104546 / IAM 13178 / JCM 8861 / NBRC 102185 / NCIMB 2190 / MS3) TaxID=547559 RepID=D3SWV2_NATMM|nr:uncharacterized protein Nmag_2269 [Natrialba magadii ATCC 43099]
MSYIFYKFLYWNITIIFIPLIMEKQLIKSMYG